MMTTSLTIPETMTAYRFTPGATQPIAEQLPIRLPEADEVVVRVLAAGVCHSDTMVLDPTNERVTKQFPSPFTMGHEGAGMVVSMGSDANETNANITVGTYVAIYGPNACFRKGCPACTNNRPNLCREHPSIGLGSDGSWADYVILRAACVVPVPASIERIRPGIVAVATDAILTPYHAMKSCGVRKGSTVLCYGAGGLGLNAIGLAKGVFKAGTVIACDIRDMSRLEARLSGADYAVTPDELVDVVGKHNFAIDFAFDFVGLQTSFDACFSVLQFGGTIHVVGLMSEKLAFSMLPAIRKDLTVRTSYWGTRDELAEVLQALADGLLKPIIEVRPMSQCAQALEDMHHGKLRARVALVPDGLEQDS